MKKKNKLTGKFVVVFDTIVDGNQAVKDEDNNPVLYNSHDEAFKEIFDGALSMFNNYSKEEIKEYAEAVTPALLKQMNKLFKSGDVKAMKEFFNKHPDLNYNEEWVEKADEFILGRKAIFTGKGVQIVGKKLK